MHNYVMTDFRRIGKRLPRILLVLAVYSILFIINLVTLTQGTLDSVNFVIMTESFIGGMPLMIGTIELIAVFSDDFKAKTMQVAIGIGIPRYKVVLGKFYETMIVVLSDAVLLGAFIFACDKVFSIGLDGSQILELTGQLAVMWLSIVSYTSIAMIIAFAMQTTGIAVLLYIVLTSNILSQILTMVSSIKVLERFHLNRFLLTSFLGMLRTHLILGSFNAAAFIGIVIYTVAGYGLTCAVFRHKELGL